MLYAENPMKIVVSEHRVKDELRFSLLATTISDFYITDSFSLYFLSLTDYTDYADSLFISSYLFILGL